MMDVNRALHIELWKLRRKMKKAGCRVKVASRKGKDGRIYEVQLRMVYDSETAST